MCNLKQCPISLAIDHIGKKWTINILRDLFLGNKRFKEFLKNNPGLSSKVLAQRLKELEKIDLIEKQITSKSPLIIEYFLSEKGTKINKILYELAIFSVYSFDKELFESEARFNEKIETQKQIEETFLLV